MTTRVCVFLRHGGQVLAERRPEDGGEASRWGLLSGQCDDSAADEPIASARQILREDIGIADGVELVRTGSPVETEEGTRSPVLFDLDEATAAGSVVESNERRQWISPTVLLHEDAAPGCWEAYERVAPTVRSVTADDDHGAAYLSVRALEILRDRAALLAAEGDADADELLDLGRRLLRARPSMAVLRNRVNRALNEATEGDGEQESGTVSEAEATTPATRVEHAATEGIERALAADADAAREAADLLGGDSVLTLSRSGTVLATLRRADPGAVFVAESRPAREGVDVAETLVESVGVPVTVHTDAAVGHVLATEDIDAVLVGADTVLPDGRVVNKTGTRVAALAAAREGVPVYTVAASDKISHEDSVNLETGIATAVYDGDANLDVRNPTFDVTPGELVTGVVTERGRLDEEDVAAVAEEHAAAAEWQNPPEDGTREPAEAEWEDH
ncbi:initiation factor 2B [Natronoarchaeum sp. GCM10025321]|uniref:initiation factor 2B n=1 Tax=Natronoarchaeum sp. GCM10025321 TaxID=3252684 RepID=UPI003617CFE4